MSEGRCVRCGRPLRNPDSLLLGIGPTCFRDWKAMFALVQRSEGQGLLDGGDLSDEEWLRRFIGNHTAAGERNDAFVRRACKAVGMDARKFLGEDGKGETRE